MIPETFTYLFVDFFTIIFPLIFSFTKWFNFKDYWRYFIPSCLSGAMIYIIWDMIYTHMGVWGFDHKYTLGVKIFNLPIEEFLFFICTPYACVFTYFCFKKYIFQKINYKWNLGWILLSVLFLIIAIFNYQKLYTCSSFLSSAIAFFLAYKFDKIRFAHFFVFYLVILIPFFIFNGILTGSFMGRVVVFYNDAENLGIRLLTIPVEDVFYGLALLLFDIIGFEYLINRNKLK